MIRAMMTQKRGLLEFLDIDGIDACCYQMTAKSSLSSVNDNFRKIPKMRFSKKTSLALFTSLLALGIHGKANAIQDISPEILAKHPISAPRVVGVVPPQAGTYTSQSTMDFRVKFNKPVDVVGEPSLPLEVGTALREGKYVGGSGTRTLRFQVTPKAGDRALHGVRFINAILADGENQILSRSGVAADVSLDNIVFPRVIVDDPKTPTDLCSYVTTINGSVPPLVATSAKISEAATDRLMQTGDGYARRSLVIKTTRAPGTRTPIHEHEFSGTTTVVQGEMTLYMDGHEPMKAVAGTSYFMPPGHKMTGVNTGDQVAIMYDSYVLPPYARNWRPLEPGFVDCLSR